jgi:antitoxin component YwqK of YwqJK toxin-antitoxin module
MATEEAKEYILHHRNGTVWAKGQTINDIPSGYWEWYRVDGTRMRSGFFQEGEQIGEWTTYDRQGNVHKITTKKGAAASRSTEGEL